MEIFRAIALNGSTSDAARHLPLSQSATSAALLELEAILQVSLFDRVGKKLLLNDHGRTLLPAALSLIDGAESVQAAFAAGAGPPLDLRVYGSMTIGNYLLPALIAGFSRTNPDAKIDLRIGNTHEAVAAVREFETDLGFIEGPCHDTEVQVTPWLDDELVVVAALEDPLTSAAKRARLSAQQLSGATWLMREPGSGTRETVEHLLLPHLAQLSRVITMGSPEAIKNAAIEGLGVTCISRTVVADAIAAKRLVQLPTRLPKLTRRFTLIHHVKKILSAPLGRFITHVKNYAESSRQQDFEI